ncbi:MAG: hypothetical protein AAF495_10500 [Pseudomonadota bacterium]
MSIQRNSQPKRAVFGKAFFALFEDWCELLHAADLNPAPGWVFCDGGLGHHQSLMEGRLYKSLEEVLWGAKQKMGALRERQVGCGNEADPCVSLVRELDLRAQQMELQRKGWAYHYQARPPLPFLYIDFGGRRISPDHGCDVLSEGSILTAAYDDPGCKAYCDDLFRVAKPHFGRMRRPSGGETCYVGPRAFEEISKGLTPRDGNFYHAFKPQRLRPPRLAFED